MPVGCRFLHQLKFDGHRALVHFEGSNVKIYTRHQTECTAQYPELHSHKLQAKNCILDGEMIVLDQNAKPCFESVMERFQASKATSVHKLSSAMPAHYVAFDILFLNGKSVMHLPLERRLELLRQVVLPGESISVCKAVDDGQTLFEAVKQHGLEGIVISKDRNSLYKPNVRNHGWIKIKNYLYDVCQIGAVRKQPTFGLTLMKVGKYVGITEFVPPRERSAFTGIMKQLVRSEDKNFIYLDPLISCKVQFQCYTKHGLMRSPSVMEFVI